MSTIQPWEISEAEWVEICVRVVLKAWIRAAASSAPLAERRALANAHRILIRKRRRAA